MEEILIVIGIALVLFVGFIIIDNRKTIFEKLKKFKPKFSFPKKEKIEKEKPQPNKVEKKEDPDSQIKEENIQYGKIEVPKDLKQTDSKLENFYASKKKEEIDLDKMFEEFRREETKENEKKYESDFLDSADIPNFNSMSLGELDDAIEQNFSSIDKNTKDSLSSFGYSNSMSGEELGKLIKNLPPEIKVLIATDILKRKF